MTVYQERLERLRAIEWHRLESAYARRSDSSRYSLSNRAYALMAEEREKKVLQLLADRGYGSLDSATVLDIGCGTGTWLRDFARWGARPENICGVDLLPGRIDQARKFSPVGVTLKCQDATDLQFADASFDLVLQSTVFTSILDPTMKQLLAREMLRLLKSDGLILWYDFHVNNPWNGDVKGVPKSEIRSLFPECQISIERLTLAPPLGRLIAPLSASLYRALSHVKPLCTHYLGAVSKK